MCYKIWRLLKLPKLSGIEPLSLQPNNCKLKSCVKFPNESGMAPVNRLLFMALK